MYHVQGDIVFEDQITSYEVRVYATKMKFTYLFSRIFIIFSLKDTKQSNIKQSPSTHTYIILFLTPIKNMP